VGEVIERVNHEFDDTIARSEHVENPEPGIVSTGTNVSGISVQFGFIFTTGFRELFTELE
jgi:hypothetical protein